METPSINRQQQSASNNDGERRKSPRTKKVRVDNTRENIPWKWSDDEDKLILEAVTNYMDTKDQLKISLEKVWGELAMRLGTTPSRVKARWRSRVHPEFDRTPMSAKDDLRLWDGHKKYGNKWKEISIHCFSGTRSADCLGKRWCMRDFQELIDTKFGRGTYERLVETLDSFHTMVNMYVS
jgi:hypothetical protein